MDGPSGGGYSLFLFIPLIPITAILAAFLLWWANREESQGLVKVAAAVLLGPWVLMTLFNGWGAAALLILFIPTSWLAPAVGVAMVIVSRKIRRKEIERHKAAAV
jgi:hypothetical protein